MAVRAHAADIGLRDLAGRDAGGAVLRVRARGALCGPSAKAPPLAWPSGAEGVARAADVLLVHVVGQRAVKHALVAERRLGTAVAVLWAWATAAGVVAGLCTLAAGDAVGIEIVAGVAAGGDADGVLNERTARLRGRRVGKQGASPRAGAQTVLEACVPEKGTGRGGLR